MVRHFDRIRNLDRIGHFDRDLDALLANILYIDMALLCKHLFLDKAVIGVTPERCKTTNTEFAIFTENISG